MTLGKTTLLNWKCLDRFLDIDLENLMKGLTWFKSINGRCIDLILTNNNIIGIIDHHHLILTILKTTFESLPPNKIIYRSYKGFNEISFKSELSYHLEYVPLPNINYLLNRHAPTQEKLLRSNHQSHANKELAKAIMLQSKLKNKANKSQCDKRAYKKKQRNYVVSLNRQTKACFPPVRNLLSL